MRIKTKTYIRELGPIVILFIALAIINYLLYRDDNTDYNNPQKTCVDNKGKL